MKILEIGLAPWLAEAFPGDVEFIDTRLRWANTRTQEGAGGGFAGRLLGLVKQCGRALRLALRQDYDAVVVRALGPVNSNGSLLKFGLLTMVGAGLRGLVAFATRGGKIKLAVLDLTDHRTIHPRDLPFLRKCQLFFKRELADNKWGSFESILPLGACLGTTVALEPFQRLLEKLRPISLGIDGQNAPAIDFSAKDYDVFYLGTNHHGIPGREQAQRVIGKLQEMGVKVFPPGERLNQAEYFEGLRRSWLGISPGGVGWECYRHRK